MNVIICTFLEIMALSLCVVLLQDKFSKVRSYALDHSNSDAQDKTYSI